MRHVLRIAAIAALLSANTAVAAEQTVKLSVANMYCFWCGPIVEGTLSAVPGVSKVVISVEEDAWGTVSATVTFDDQMTTVDALIEAVTNAGFPTELAAAAEPMTQSP